MQISTIDVSLVNAIANDDEKRIRNLLQGGADPNGLIPEIVFDSLTPKPFYKTADPTTPLMRAVSCEASACFQALIESGADVNRQTVDMGRTAVMVAVEDNNPKFLLLVINAGGDVNMKSANGFTPAMRAASNNCVECLDLLIKANADLDCVSGPILGSKTAAMMAAACGHDEALDLLLRAGASVRIPAERNLSQEEKLSRYRLSCRLEDAADRVAGAAAIAVTAPADALPVVKCPPRV